MCNSIMNGQERLSSYVSACGITVYEREFYHEESDTWYICGDSSTNRELIEAEIKHNNLLLQYKEVMGKHA